MLLSKIKANYRALKLRPDHELLEYAKNCDLYSHDQITLDNLGVALCRYLDTTAIRNHAISLVIDRIREPSMSEVFTAAVNMSVHAILHNPMFRGTGYHASSERSHYLPNKKYLKPDIGIWKGGTLKAVVECKTNLGYDRLLWEQNFAEKSQKYIGSGVCKDSVCLVVTTDSNWSGFPISDPRVGTTWTSLCKRGSWFGGRNNSLLLQDSFKSGSMDAIVLSILNSI